MMTSWRFVLALIVSAGLVALVLAWIYIVGSITLGGLR